MSDLLVIGARFHHGWGGLGWIGHTIARGVLYNAIGDVMRGMSFLEIVLIVAAVVAGVLAFSRG